MSGSAWGGRAAAKYRAHFAPQLPLPCLRCGQPVHAHQAWEVDHRLSRDAYPELTHDLANMWPSHRRCNRRAGQAITTAKRTRSRRIAAAVSRRW